MDCTRNVTSDLLYVGADDRRLALFEGVYSVGMGVSYNSYLLRDEVNVLFDTVDKAVGKTFFENLEKGLGGQPLSYVVVQHMEPDHSATLEDLLRLHPETTVICNAKTAAMFAQFSRMDISERTFPVTEQSTVNTGHHVLHFVMAPMVHWPEVMMTFDETDGILFSADAFGTFGALNGALFADEVDFMADYLGEARRYYCNIVGKYGGQVQAALKKTAALDIRMICPLHGFVWRRNLSDYLEKYRLWSTYTPEEQGVMIAYASVYGHTENAANILACRLRDAGIRTVMYDVSVTPASDIVAAAFRFSHLVFASATYNAGIFVSMDALLRDLQAHGLQRRTVALIENGSWAPQSGRQMREILTSCRDMTILGSTVSLKSALRPEQSAELDALVQAIRDSMPAEMPAPAPAPQNPLEDTRVFRSFTYGLFVLTARNGLRDTGCIINTLQQITSSPSRVSIAVNKQNYTAELIRQSGEFNVSVLSEDAPFSHFTRFGFQSGRDTDKFAGFEGVGHSENGRAYLTDAACSFLSARVTETLDCGTHYLFLAEVTESRVLSAAAPMTYAYYFAHVKPKPEAPKEEDTGKKRWVCSVCGYVYEGDSLPEDFVCPLCKHGADAFEPAE